MFERTDMYTSKINPSHQINPLHPQHKIYTKIYSGREVLVGFAGSAFFGMLVMLVSKELAADIAIQVCGLVRRVGGLVWLGGLDWVGLNKI